MLTFSQKHYRKVAKWLGQMEDIDSFVQMLTEKFGRFFKQDNDKFDFKKFQSTVTREREGKTNV